MKNFYESMYDRAQAPEQLPWHRENVPSTLLLAIDHCQRGTVLDIGCGTGVYATFLAERGFSVTAIDYVPTALKMAQQRAAAKQVTIDFRVADVLQWQPDRVFDLIFDSGCFHSFADAQSVQTYKQRLLQWLAPQGSFILSHFGRRNFWDWRPIGPRRRTREEVRGFFAPELTEKAYADELIHPPFPIGPTAQLGHYWFIPTPAT